MFYELLGKTVWKMGKMKARRKLGKVSSSKAGIGAGTAAIGITALAVFGYLSHSRKSHRHL
jgi:hypothetical protein